MKLKQLVGILYSIVIAYAVIVGAMVVLQRKLMFFPDRNIAAPADYGLQGFEDIRYASADGTRLQAWYRAPDQGRKLIIYFHGNASNLGNRAGMFAAFAQAGYGVLGLSYRGYGRSEGSPAEAGMMDDARSTLKQAADLGYTKNDLVLYGESLGTGIAVRMADEFGAGVLALQSPYTSVAGRAAEIYWWIPVRWLIKDKFESLGYIAQLEIPTLIFHGELDRTIPMRHGKTILDAAKGPKQGVFYPNVGHTEFDPADVTRALNDFIAKHATP